MGFVKIGYFRAVSEHDEVYVSYKEYLSWDNEQKEFLKVRVDQGRLHLFCACCAENKLELTVTSNHVVRVSTNNGQDNHMESCPKSIYYERWNEQNKLSAGAVSQEDGVLFRISIPQVLKSSSKSSSSGSSGTGTPRDKRMGVREVATSLNAIAWEKQTFSKKKEIREANKNGQPQTWQYKSLEEFNRLIFGVSNDIACEFHGNVVPFINLCYRRDAFYQCTDWRMEWFMYAVIDKISEIKKSRKYQYITVLMPSLNSPKKAVIRVETAACEALLNGFEEEAEGMSRVLAGYINRRIFLKEDGTSEEWINLVKGCILRVSKNGLYVENATAGKVANYLSDNRIIFKKPYSPLENYGNEIPSFLIERLHGKDILIDCVDEKTYADRQIYTEHNEEYDCILIKEGEEIEKLKELIGDKK